MFPPETGGSKSLEVETGGLARPPQADGDLVALRPLPEEDGYESGERRPTE